jgi:hypothetical protein
VAFGTSIEMKTRIFLLLVAAAVPAAAQHQAPPGADPAQVKPLVERKDVVSWKVFAQVELVKMKDRYVPQFSPAVAALDQKVVKVQGFMMPLQVGDKQTHFVLSAMPVTCSFCMPGGPEALVEVKAKQPFKYGFEPITVSGKLSVLKEEPTGVFYRITDAVQAN